MGTIWRVSDLSKTVWIVDGQLAGKDRGAGIDNATCFSDHTLG